MGHYKYRFTKKYKTIIKSMPQAIAFASTLITTLLTIFLEVIPKHNSINFIIYSMIIIYCIYLVFFFIVMKMTINSSFKNVDKFWDMLLNFSFYLIVISSTFLGIIIGLMLLNAFFNVDNMFVQSLFFIDLLIIISSFSFIFVLPQKKKVKAKIKVI